MNRRFKLGRSSRQQVKGVSGSAQPNAPSHRRFSSTLSRTGRIGRGASRVAADTVSGAIKAADEISGEASVFVRDAVIGVIEGTSRVASVSRPVVREVASAAVISSTELGGEHARIRQASCRRGHCRSIEGRGK